MRANTERVKRERLTSKAGGMNVQAIHMMYLIAAGPADPSSLHKEPIPLSQTLLLYHSVRWALDGANRASGWGE